MAASPAAAAMPEFAGDQEDTTMASSWGTGGRGGAAASLEVIQLQRMGALWVRSTEPVSDQVRLEQACLAFTDWVQGMVSTVLKEGSSEHCRRGHFPHDPKCIHCVRARMRHKYKRRRKTRVVEGPSKGLRLSADLMGPFTSELMGHLYSLMVVDDEYRWAAVGGLKDKSSAGCSDTFADLVREIQQFTDRTGETVARVHTDMTWALSLRALSKPPQKRRLGFLPVVPVIASPGGIDHLGD